MALERLQALALFRVPQNDLVVTPAAREKLAVKTGDRLDPFAAIFSNVREHICNGRLRLPPLNLRLSPGRAKHERKMLSPVALQAQNFRSCLCADEMDAPI